MDPAAPAPLPTEADITHALQHVEKAIWGRRMLLLDLARHPAGGLSEMDQQLAALGTCLQTMQAAIALIVQLPEFRP